MAALTERCDITPSSSGKISEPSLEKEGLQSADLEKGISFFKDQCVVRVANRLDLRQKAYELLYDNYSNMGIIPKKPGGLWLSIYDALPETTTITAKNADIEGALTLVFDSPIGLPADELYKEEIDELRNAGRKICEIISFGINKAGRSSIKILASLFYSAYLLSLRIRNSTDFVITVHANHEDFYSRNLLFKKMGPVRNYAKVNGKPTILLNLPLSLPENLRVKRRIFPLHMLKYPEWKELEVAKKIEEMISPISDEEFYTFFIEKTDCWEKASDQQREYIKRTYPPNGTNHFAVSRALASEFSKRLQSASNSSEN
jgi:hypothetical protein